MKLVMILSALATLLAVEVSRADVIPMNPIEKLEGRGSEVIQALNATAKDFLEFSQYGNQITDVSIQDMSRRTTVFRLVNQQCSKGRCIGGAMMTIKRFFEPRHGVNFPRGFNYTVEIVRLR